MLKFVAMAALTLGAVAVAAAPALAKGFDAFTSFNGTQGAGGFTYGSIDDAMTTPTLFGANTNCFIAGSVCLQAAPNFDVPGATKSAMASFQYGSVNVPTDRLLVHPGPTAANGGVYVTFTAPIRRMYGFTATFNVQDVRPTGTIVSLWDGYSFVSQTLDADNPLVVFGGARFLDAGDTITAIVNRDYNYYNDSTGLNFKLLTALPEPGTWVMMIIGFGLIGVSVRRREAALA